VTLFPEDELADKESMREKENSGESNTQECLQPLSSAANLHSYLPHKRMLWHHLVAPLDGILYIETSIMGGGNKRKT
jgi:hypothetical protein